MFFKKSNQLVISVFSSSTPLKPQNPPGSNFFILNSVALQFFADLFLLPYYLFSSVSFKKKKPVPFRNENFCVPFLTAIIFCHHSVSKKLRSFILPQQCVQKTKNYFSATAMCQKFSALFSATLLRTSYSDHLCLERGILG